MRYTRPASRRRGCLSIRHQARRQTGPAWESVWSFCRPGICCWSGGLIASAALWSTWWGWLKSYSNAGSAFGRSVMGRLIQPPLRVSWCSISFSALAQFERRLIQERTRAGLAAARARGRLGGRPALAPEDTRVQMAKTLYEAGAHEIGAICKTLGISRSTFYRYLAFHIPRRRPVRTKEIEDAGRR